MGAIKQYKSETVLFFIATAIASVMTELAADPEFKASLGEYATFIVFGMSVAGYLLRRSSTNPLEPIITRKKPPPSKDIRKKHEEILNQSDDAYAVNIKP